MEKNSNSLPLSDRDSRSSEILEKAPASWNDLLTGKNGIYALVLAGGVMLHAVNMYIAITIMPSAVLDIGGLDYYAWTTTLFVIASVLGAALTVKLLEWRDPRGAYFVATLLFALGTLTCSLAANMPVMLIGRTIQGMGGGFLYALAFALTRVVFPERIWGRAIGLISAMFGIATLIGPAIGGIFAEYDIWRAAFWFVLPFAGAFAILAHTTLPKSSGSGVPAKSSPVPFLQLCLLTGSVLAISAGSLSLQLIWNMLGLFAALVLIALIALVEMCAQLSGKVRLLPEKSFNISAPMGALYLTIALLMLSMQPEIFVPYLLQKLHGQSPLWAGYLGALMAIGWTMGSLLSARWQRGGGGKLIIGGPILVLIGLILFALFMPMNGAGDWLVLLPICLGLLLIGVGIGLAWPSLVNRVYLSASNTEQSLAAGAMTTIQLFAIALGAACAGMVANFAGISDPGGLKGASNTAFWLSGVFIIAPILCIAMAVRVVRITTK